jgi:sulfotransferase
MQKTFYFLNGMPRSGSTLLANMLNQNPRFWATPTSGLCPLLLQTNATWNGISELRASATSLDKTHTLRGMLDQFHSSCREVVIDKSRGWVCAFELLENILGHKPKIIVTYRDIPSILSSCEKLFRRELANPASTAQFARNMETLEGRLAHWTSADQLVGGAYNRIRDCVARGHREHIHFVDFDDLTTAPCETMQAIYDFLGEPWYPEHKFNNVEQTTSERDSEHGFVDLHTIRPDIKPMRKDYREILGDAIRPYLNISYEFI